MTGEEGGRSLRAVLRGSDRGTTVVLVAATVLMVLFKYGGSREFYAAHVARHVVVAGDPAFSAALWHFGSAAVLLGLVPLAIVRFVLRRPLAEFGVASGDLRWGLRAGAVLAPAMVLLAIPSARRPEFAAEYPLDRAAGASGGHFALHALLYLVLFYASWEFFFRGFLQNGVRGALGDWNAILVQTLASTLLHVGKPFGETMGAIAGGLAWGFVAHRSRSLLVPVLTHWLLGLSLDFLIVCG